MDTASGVWYFKDMPHLHRPWMCRVLLMLLVMSLAGCAATSADAPGTPTGPVSEVRDLRVLTSPAPVALEQGSSPDGVWAQVYALRAGQSRAIELPAGTLELLLFDGTIRAREASEHEPFLRIRYRSAELAGAASQTFAGTRYAVPVRWGDHRPESGILTLVVRFIPDHGEPVASSAVSIRLMPV